MKDHVCCDLYLCAQQASYIRVYSPAREFLHYLCAHHWNRLQAQRPDLASCYESIRQASPLALPGPIVLIAGHIAARSPWIHSLQYSLNSVFRASA